MEQDFVLQTQVAFGDVILVLIALDHALCMGFLFLAQLLGCGDRVCMHAHVSTSLAVDLENFATNPRLVKRFGGIMDVVTKVLDILGSLAYCDPRAVELVNGHWQVLFVSR